MRYEVRQQDGKRIVWDTVNCESLKALERAVVEVGLSPDQSRAIWLRLLPDMLLLVPKLPVSWTAARTMRSTPRPL